MQPILDYFLLVVNKLVEILNSLSFNGSFSLLYYMLGAIIIGFIIKLIKGGSSEFEQNTNFLNSRIVSTGVYKYGQSHSARKEQLVSQSKPKTDPSTTYIRVNEWQSHLFGGKTRMTLAEYNRYIDDMN